MDILSYESSQPFHVDDDSAIILSGGVEGVRPCILFRTSDVKIIKQLLSYHPRSIFIIINAEF